VLFPRQAVTLSTQPGSPTRQALCSLAWRAYEGRIAVLSPVGRTAVEVRILFDSHMLDGEFPTPAGVAHAIVGDRLRLVKVCNETAGATRDLAEAAEAGWPISAFEPVVDVDLSEARAEKVADEAARTLQLLERGVESGAFALEPSHLDDELGMQPEGCDPRCHPLWAACDEPPVGAAISFWLAARLPLSTSLRAAILASTCPLKRLHDVNVTRTRPSLNTQKTPSVQYP